RAKIQRLKVSLKLLDYNPKRDFAGWGGEDIRALRGMPGFSHIAALSRVDPEAQAVSVVDFDGDGKPDLCLVGAGKVVLLDNGYNGLRLYRNNPPKELAQKLVPPKFGEWHHIGPFDDTGRKGFATAYPPEKEINLGATYDGKNKAKVKWNKANLPDGQLQ